ncbi:MAG: hypothetical protein Q6L68_16190 [Thermostichus sp. DG02_5_bins_236]
MYSLLLTYGLNPLTGLKVLVKSPEPNSLWGLARQFFAPSASGQRRPRLQVSLGRLVPEETEHLSKVEALLRLKFFIALEAETPGKSLPALPSGQGSAIQVYRQAAGTEHYKTEVIRFAIGGSRARLHASAPASYKIRRRR